MGTRKTKVPSIPEPRPDNLLEVARALKEVTEVAEKRRGDPLDAKVTYRDLIDGGLASINVGGGGGVGAGISDPTDRTTPGPNSPFLKPPTFDGLVLPGRPANVHTLAVWDGIQVIWDWPDAAGSNTYWKRAVVWASATPSFDHATIIGFSTQNFYTHTGIGLSAPTIDDVITQPGVRYYWVQWEGIYNELKGVADRTDTNPYQWEEGIRGQTALDPEYVLNLMEGQVRESHLYSLLGERIDLVDTDPDNPDGPRFTEPVETRILLAADVTAAGVYAAIEKIATSSVSDDGNDAQGEYSIRVDANGHVAGFGLSAYSRINSETGTRESGSDFIIRASRFSIVQPIPLVDIYPNQNLVDHFIIPFTVGTVGGVPTVGINGQLVIDGTIYADSIQAGQIGTAQLNAQEVYTDLLDAKSILTGSLATSVDPNARVEINGEGVEKELIPLWYGRGTTGGSESVFFMDRFGTMKLAGELYVTGAGKFFAGNFEQANEYRIEIGGAEDDFMLWAGSGIKRKSNDNFAFWIDRFGNAKFKGDLEARYVSGEISQQTPIQDSNKVQGKKTNGHTAESVGGGDWTTLGQWLLPASVFQAHLPTITVNFSLYGPGVIAGAYRILYKNGSNNFTEVIRGIVNTAPYGTDHTVVATGNGKTKNTTQFRLQFAGTAGDDWENGDGPIESGRRFGYLLGLR